MVYHVQFPGLGLDLTVNRVALAIGGFNIYWYGVIIAAGLAPITGFDVTEGREDFFAAGRLPSCEPTTGRLACRACPTDLECATVLR